MAEAEQQVKEEQVDVDAAEDRLDDAVSDGETSAAEVDQLQDDVTKQEQQLDRAKEERRTAEHTLKTTLESAATSTAGTSAQPAGGIDRPGDAALIAIAEQVSRLQENYLRDSDADGLMVRCLTASEREPVTEICHDLFEFLMEDHVAQRVAQQQESRRGRSYPSILERLLVGDYRNRGTSPSDDR